MFWIVCVSARARVFVCVCASTLFKRKGVSAVDQRVRFCDEYIYIYSLSLSLSLSLSRARARARQTDHVDCRLLFFHPHVYVVVQCRFESWLQSRA